MALCFYVFRFVENQVESVFIFYASQKRQVKLVLRFFRIVENRLRKFSAFFRIIEGRLKQFTLIVRFIMGRLYGNVRKQQESLGFCDLMVGFLTIHLFKTSSAFEKLFLLRGMDFIIALRDSVLCYAYYKNGKAHQVWRKLQAIFFF